MTRLASRTRYQEGADLVTRGAPVGENRVFAVQRESGDTGVIEGPLIERPQFAAGARMFDVARHAVILDVAMHAEPPGNPVGHWFMTREALLGGDAPSALVALLAVRDPFEVCVSPRELTGRQQRAKLGLRPLRSREPGRKDQDQQTQHPYHLNGT
jgi:hypothetical protein